jgi:hypothetical protein
MDKKCFTPIHCPLHSKCHFANIDFKNGYFNPTNVGEFCHSFQPMVVESDPWHTLANLAGAHE